LNGETTVWQTFFATFWMVFLAELGDKTQLTVLAQSAGGNKWTVLLAAVSALSLASFLGVVVGGAMGKWLPERAIRLAGGALFLVFGAVMLFSGLRGGTGS